MNVDNAGKDQPIDIQEYPYPMCEIIQNAGEENENIIHIWDAETADRIIKSLKNLKKALC